MAPRAKDDEVPESDKVAQYNPEGSLKLSSGFGVYPENRDGFLDKNPILWMAGKKKVDNIGDLWRIHDKLYDLSEFLKTHPGGSYWLEVTQGADITESFISSHLGPTPEKMLEKFYVKEAERPRNSPFTFKTDGFYMTMRKKAWSILKEKGTGPDLDMYLIQDGLVSFFFFFFLMAAWQHSTICILIASVFLYLAVATAHNFFHQRDNWRVYIFDLMLFSSREWRISHALSHHVFPNTIYDYEISVFEPHMELLAKKNKSLLNRYGAVIPGFLTFILGPYVEALKRILLICQGKISFHWTNTIVFLQLAVMIILSQSPSVGIKLWLILHSCSNTLFLGITLAVAHHHPDIYHEGDVYLEEKDFGLAQVVATRDRGYVMTNLFLTAVSFGNHTLHHLFPTVDHSKLPLLIPVLLETCKEFGVEFTLMTPMELFLGLYRLMSRNKPNPKPPNVIKQRKE